MPELLDGFKVGEYFISFPPGEFVKEDDKGEMYVEVDVYQLDDKGETQKVNKKDITPDVHQLISEELNRIILKAIDEIELDSNSKSE
jgi:hypothetical protein